MDAAVARRRIIVQGEKSNRPEKKELNTQSTTRNNTKRNRNILDSNDRDENSVTELDNGSPRPTPANASTTFMRVTPDNEVALWTVISESVPPESKITAA